MTVIFFGAAYAQQNNNTFLKDFIQTASSSTKTLVVVNTEIVSREVILFYQLQHYRTAWKRPQNIMAMIQSIRSASAEGLNPQDYHLALLENLYEKKNKSAEDEVAFDLLLTDAFLSYGKHLLSGKVDPQQLYDREWETSKRQSDLKLLLQDALREQSVKASLDELKPAYKGYRNLKKALSYYRTIKSMGGWNSIAEGKPLKPGDVDARIPAIRNRLSISNQSLIAVIGDSSLYDSLLAKFIVDFQRQHGLRDDGVIGKSTLTALNRSVEDYIQTIIMNMERYRWLPQQLGNQYIIINIAGYSLEVWEDDTVALAMKIIVGRPERRTPVLSSMLKYLIINPTWTVPPTILKEDVLPAVKQNIHYLKRNNLRVFTHGGEEVDPTQLRWSSFSERNFPYIIRQDPGEKNSLGLIKFHFPNHHSIFLHDTNYPFLFNEQYRALSSGCIRLEKPMALARYALRDTRWEKKIEELIAAEKTETVVIKNPVPLHIFYFTAFADDRGRLQLRPDIYNWDEVMLPCLNYPPEPGQ